MPPSAFDTLLSLVRPYIERQVTSFQEPIPPHDRLAMTISYASSGVAGRVINRVTSSAKNTSRPRDGFGSDTIVLLLRTLAFDVLYEVYAAADMVEVDELLKEFQV
ncbi:hypothetical protein MTO96_022434 [Rhipicephalus appendiculatus]